MIRDNWIPLIDSVCVRYHDEWNLEEGDQLKRLARGASLSWEWLLFKKIGSETMFELMNDFLWSKLLVVILIGIGLLFTISSRFVQFRYFTRMFRILVSGHLFSKNQEGHLSSFQVLMLSVAGRVGGGNIAGVAVAITLGGPGAVFWMWVMGLIGMATSFVECTLAQAYKRTAPGGGYFGGPAFYIIHGLGRKWKWLASLFSALLFVTFGFGFNSAQSYAVAVSLHDAFDVSTIVLSFGLACVVGIIISGGIKRIAKIADILVPFMVFGYILLACIVLVLNFHSIPSAFFMIIKSAFGFEPLVGGGIGVAVTMGRYFSSGSSGCCTVFLCFH